MTDKTIPASKILHPPKDILQTTISHEYGLCERQKLGLWEEPLNVISSFAFFIVGILIYFQYRKKPEFAGKKMYDIYLLNILVFAIGVASVVFHTSPSYYTELMDITLIVVFVIIYFISMLFRVFNLTAYQVSIAFLAFLGTTHILVSQFDKALNDSIGYLSSMVALIAVAIYLNIQNRPSARHYLLAAVIGGVSFFFRAVDNAICEKMSTGTHFLWHSCNAALIYVLLKQLVRSLNRRHRMLHLAGEAGL